MDNNDLLQAPRRYFLAQLGGLTVIGTLGTSLLTPHRVTTAQAAIEAIIPKESVFTRSHWGAIRATVKSGHFVAAESFELDKCPSKMIIGLPDHIHNAARICYLMICVDWLRKRYLSDVSQRGDNRFARVSWDEALDVLCEELERVQRTHEPNASLTANGWQSTGIFHNTPGMLAKAIALHGNSIGTDRDHSTDVVQVILSRVAGSMEVYEQQISWPLALQSNKTTMLRGPDLLKNQQVNWWCPDHDIYEYYEQLKVKVAAGEIEVVSIDPVVVSTHEYLGHEHVKHIMINLQIDVPLQLTLAHTSYSENLYDRNLLANYCVGFEQLLPYLLGEEDSQPKDAAWTEKLAGIDTEAIHGLARRTAASRTQTIAS